MREVAFDRYRRNHEHMAEIVSPYALSEIIKPGIFQGVDTKWITSLAVGRDWHRHGLELTNLIFSVFGNRVTIWNNYKTRRSALEDE